MPQQRGAVLRDEAMTLLETRGAGPTGSAEPATGALTLADLPKRASGIRSSPDGGCWGRATWSLIDGCSAVMPLDCITVLIDPGLVVSDASAQPETAPPAAAGRTRVRSLEGELFRGFLSVQSRGVVALPPALRRRYQLDLPGAQVEVTEREDGVLEVRPVIAVPATEAWFWGSRWQSGEREVEEHVRAGQVTVSDSADELLADLVALDDEATAAAETAAGPAANVGDAVRDDRTAMTGQVADEG